MDNIQTLDMNIIGLVRMGLSTQTHVMTPFIHSYIGNANDGLYIFKY